MQSSLRAGGREGTLTFVEAVSLMTGAGVGAGIMAVPYLAARSGLLEMLVVVVVAFGANCLIHLMLAEVAFRSGRNLQVIELMRLHLFRDRFAPLLWSAFALLGLAFVAILAAYVAGGSEIVADLTGVSRTPADVVVYLACAAVVFFGLGAVGLFEKVATGVLVVITAVLVAGSFGVPFRPVWSSTAGWESTLALYGMVMYAFYTFYTVPQVVKGLAPDQRSAVKAIIVGLAINAGLVTTIALIAVGVSHPVTEVAVVGMADAIGGWAGTAGSLFVFVALVTSYWSISLALADILSERIGLGRRTSWVVATLPSLLVLLAGGWRFLEWLRLAGGATALVVVVVTVPMYLDARRHGQPDTWSLGRFGSWPWLVAVTLAALLMAVGSLLEL